MIETSTGVLVAGAGAAGHSAVTTLRQEGYAGPLTVLHAEPHAAHNRTLVNKAVLQGLLTAEQISPCLPWSRWTCTSFMRASSRSTPMPPRSYWTTGTGCRTRHWSPRPAVSHALTIPAAATLLRSCTSNTLDDAERIRDRMGNDSGRKSVTLLGAGFISAETASKRAGAGATVHLVFRPAVPLAGVLGEHIARRVTELHAAHLTTHFGSAPSPRTGTRSSSSGRRTSPGVRRGDRGPRHGSSVGLGEGHRGRYRRRRSVASRWPQPRLRRRKCCRACRADGAVLSPGPLGRRDQPGGSCREDAAP